MLAVTAIRAIDTFAAQRAGGDDEVGAKGIIDDEGRRRTAPVVITIRRSSDEVYAFFRDMRNFPRFMAHLDSVESSGKGRSRWSMRIFAGRRLTWEVEIVEERAGALLSWRARPGAAVDSRGRVRFVAAPGGRGTEVHADIRYRAPVGGVGVMIAKMFGFEPGKQVRKDLQRLKQLLETGEIVRSDASIHPQLHAAQPPSAEDLRQYVAREVA